jgi:hypothetical protein
MKALTGTEWGGGRRRGEKNSVYLTTENFLLILVFVFESGSIPDSLEGRLQILKLKDL